MKDEDVDNIVNRVTKEKTEDEPVTPAEPTAAVTPIAPAPEKPANPANPPAQPANAPAAQTPPANPAQTPAAGELNFDDIDIPDQVLGNKNAPAQQPAPAPAEEEPKEAKNWNVATRQAFASLRARLNAAEDQLQKLKTAPPPAVDPNLAAQTIETVANHQKQVDALRAELDKAYDLVSRVKLEADPRFKAKYDVPKQAVFEQIKDIVTEWQVKDETIQDILKASPKRRIELANEISPDVLPLLAPLLAQYDHVDKMRKMDLDRATATLSEQEQIHAQELATKDKVGRMAMFKNAALKVLSDGHFVFRQLEGAGNEKWNKNVAVLQAKVQALFSKDDPLAQAEHLILGVAAPVYLSLYRKEKALREDLQKQLKENFGMRPALDGRTSETPRAPRANADEATASDIVGDVMAELRK